jgi:WD40 repeat protein
MRKSLRFAVALVFFAPVTLVLTGCAGTLSSSFLPTTMKSVKNPAQTIVIPTSFTPTGTSPNTGAGQGVAMNGNVAAYTNSTSWITKYTANWTAQWKNYKVLTGLPAAATHMGDPEYYNGKIIAPVENYNNCSNFSSQTLAVFDGSTGSLITWADISADGHEISSVTVVPEKNQVVVSSFCNVKNGNSTLWIYDLNALLTNAPGSKLAAIGTIKVSAPIQFIQGISWNSNYDAFLVSADIGTAGSLYYIAPDGTVSGPAYVVPGTQSAELEGVDFTTGTIYFLENGIIYGLGSPTEAPSLSPAPGPVKGNAEVSIVDATSGAVIHYTTDGSVPTSASPVYKGTFKIKNNTTVSAIAFVNGTVNSPMTVGLYK